MNDHRSPRTLLALFIAAALLMMAGCGDSGASKEELREARQAGAKQAREQLRIRQIQKELKELRKKNGPGQSSTAGGSVSPAPESVTSSGNCGGSLSVNENTSCGFAENVEAAYYSEIGSGSGTVAAYSPATGETYSMYCTAGSPHECTGGNNAAVYFP